MYKKWFVQYLEGDSGLYMERMLGRLSCTSQAITRHGVDARLAKAGKLQLLSASSTLFLHHSYIQVTVNPEYLQYVGI